MPNGAIVRGILETFIKDELVRRGYQPVYTPHIGKIELYQTSGHYPYYKDSQFPPLKMPSDSSAKELLDGLISGSLDDKAQRVLLGKAGIPETLPGQAKSFFDMGTPERIGYLEQTCDMEEYLLKPMNCPHHIQIYAAHPRSYRELPLRLAEFGTVYRYEQPGELLGLTRVRGFTQDDAHLFCTHEQVRGEFRSTMDMTQFFLNSCLGLSDYRVRLSKSDPNDPKYQGAAGEIWRRAEEDIRSVLDEMGLPYDEAPGEAAFYGPKADFIVRDCIGRQWQLGTVQLDYVLPERFELEYIGPDNQPHRPVMIHRAPLGSMERFMGILIEHFAGAFPLWLAPEQVRVLPISDKVADYSRHVLARLLEKGFRASIDLRAEKIGHKIRDAQLEKIPAMLVVGAKEAENEAVSYRDRVDGDLGAMPLAEALARLDAERTSRRSRQTAPPEAPAVADENGAEDHTY
jgi:threonyl-tRNA synthetase